MQLRTYNIAPLFLGTDGLTVAQQNRMAELVQRMVEADTNPKKKLTDKMVEELDKLMETAQQEPELPQGAMTLIEEYVDAELYGYKDSFSSKETEKGLTVENDSIELYNDVFFTDHKKLVEGDEFYELSHDILVGHPDVVCVKTKMVKDAKSSWNKKTFPKTPEKAKNSTHMWQVKTYLYMLRMMTNDMGWRHGEVFYCLSDTPETLVPEWEDDSLHDMSNVPDNLRITVVPVELTDEDVAHMTRRLGMAKRYAEKYRQTILNKNK